MLKKYNELYKQATAAFKEIYSDKVKIEQGLKEKPCFKPIINTIELSLLCGILKNYINQLENVIKILDKTEGADNESS
jgi:hypothetical protein